MWFSVVCTLIDNDIRKEYRHRCHHSGQLRYENTIGRIGGNVAVLMRKIGPTEALLSKV